MVKYEGKNCGKAKEVWLKFKVCLVTKYIFENIIDIQFLKDLKVIMAKKNMMMQFKYLQVRHNYQERVEQNLAEVGRELVI